MHDQVIPDDVVRGTLARDYRMIERAIHLLIAHEPLRSAQVAMPDHPELELTFMPFVMMMVYGSMAHREDLTSTAANPSVAHADRERVMRLVNGYSPDPWSMPGANHPDETLSWAKSTVVSRRAQRSSF